MVRGILSRDERLSALTSTINLGKTALALRDQKVIDDALTEMNQKLMEVTQSALALLAERHSAIEEANALRERHRKLQESLNDLARYETYWHRLDRDASKSQRRSGRYHD